ncbi:MAG: hypothetical protein NZO58_00310 [Gemmataceae bacterium]|nr:hypothetical protein [Gemmataceae bacterium]
MSWSAAWAALAGVVVASCCLAGPLQPFAPKLGYRDFEFRPFQAQSHHLDVKGGEPTQVIVFGITSSPMGVYVYDPHGNCVAHDDASTDLIVDKLLVEFHPPQTAGYEVVIRNLGRKLTQAEVAIR